MAHSAHVDTFAADRLPPRDAWPVLVGLDDLGYPERLNAAVELVEGTIGRHGAERPAIRGVGPAWSYGELAEQVRRAANVLEDLGGERFRDPS